MVTVGCLSEFQNLDRLPLCRAQRDWLKIPHYFCLTAYLEATWSQRLPDWIGSHVRALEFFGGVPAILVPDNLRSGVTAAHRYEPELNPTYQDFALHYGMAVLPARSRKPRDKAKVENAVLVTERWILARLRRHTFFTLAALNTAIGEAVADLNRRPFQK